MIGKWWLIAGLLILIGIIFLPLRLAVRLQRLPNHLELTLRFYIWFIPLKIKFVNPMTNLIQMRSTNKFWQEKAPDELSFKDVNWRRLLARIKLFYNHLLPIYSKINKFYHRISQPIKIKQLALYTEIGLGDAAVTAISVGMIWSVLGFLYTRIAEIFNTREAKNQINVVANFQQSSYLGIDYSCIFEFRLGHIIVIVYYFLCNISEIRKLTRSVTK